MIVSRYHIFVQMPEAYEIRLESSVLLGFPIDVQPAGSETDPRTRRIVFRMDAQSASEGTTFSLTYRHRRPFWGARGFVENLYPGLEIVSDLSERSLPVNRSGDAWTILDDESQTFFEIIPPADREPPFAINQNTISVVERRVLYFDSGARQW
jgi:hypothetical protein